MPDALIMQLSAMGASATAHVDRDWHHFSAPLSSFLDGNAIFDHLADLRRKICPLFRIDMVNFGVVMTLLIMMEI